MFNRSHLLSALAAVCLLVSAILAASQNFRPDVVFRGSTLAGWHTLGQADWRAQDGEIIGTPRQGGGWLVLDKGYQDIAFYSSFRCSGACKGGVLLRAEKTPEGMKGVFVSLAEGDVAAYDWRSMRREGVAAHQTGIRSGSDDPYGGRAVQRRRRTGAGFSKPAPTRAELACGGRGKGAAASGGGGGGRGGRGGPALDRK